MPLQEMSNNMLSKEVPSSLTLKVLPSNMTTKQDVTRKYHINKKRKDILQCDSCDEAFADPSHLHQHVMSEHKTFPETSICAPEHIYPPKKRAMYDYKRYNDIERTSDQIKHGQELTKNAHIDSQDSVKMKWPVNQDLHTYHIRRPRSDSIPSIQSLTGDHSSGNSTYLQEPSSHKLPDVYDHHTPERNSVVGRLGQNSDISKPLFPSSDSEEDNEDISSHNSEKFTFQRSNIPAYLVNTSSHDINSYTFQKDIPHNTTNNIAQNGNSPITFGLINADNDNFKSSVRSDKIQDSVVSHSNHVIDTSRGMVPSTHGTGNTNELSKSRNSANSQNTCMGPMVSLLDRFNTHDLPRIQHGQEIKINSDNKSLLHKPQINISDHITQKQIHARDSLKIAMNLINENKLVNEIYKCSVCNKEFRQSGNFHNHMKTHTGVTCHCKCGLCDEAFDTSNGLQLHMRMNHTGSNPYKCQHCDREFSQYNNLRRHLRVHREKIYKCTSCAREFNEEFYLTMHMSTHTGHRVYSCGVCNAGFQSSHDLKSHVKTHSPSQLHVCSVCGKAFSKACVLRQHKKAHSGERPHKCTQCTKTFIHRHHLTMHLRSHTSSKPYSCDYCNKEFSQSSHLYKHVRQHEEEETKENSGEAVQLQDVSPALKNNSNVLKVNNITNRTVLQTRHSEINPIVEKPTFDGKHKVQNHADSVGLKLSETKMNNAENIETEKAHQKQRRLSQVQTIEKSDSDNHGNDRCVPVNPAPNIYPNMLTPFWPHVPPFVPFPPHLPTMFTMPSAVANLPSYHGYEQMYQHYTSQFHEYYNSYMRNYVSQAAMLGQGNLEKLQSHLTRNQAPSQKPPVINTSMGDTVHRQTYEIKSNHLNKNEKQSEIDLSTRGSPIPHDGQMKSNHNKVKTNDDSKTSRTEIAHELLKMATSVHHNSTDVQNPLKDHGVIGRAEGHAEKLHELTKDSHLNSNSTENCDTNRTGMTDYQNTRYLAKQDCKGSLTNISESLALNLSHNRHVSESDKFEQNHATNDYDTYNKHVGYRLNQSKKHSGESGLPLNHSHPVAVPLQSTLSCNKTGHFQMHEPSLKGIRNTSSPHTAHVYRETRQLRQEGQNDTAKKVRSTDHKDEMNSYFSVADGLQHYVSHAADNASEMKITSNNLQETSLVTFSKSFLAPKSSYILDCVKDSTAYSSFPGFRTVHTNKGDISEKHTQQNINENCKLLQQSTSDIVAEDVNSLSDTETDIGEFELDVNNLSEVVNDEEVSDVDVDSLSDSAKISSGSSDLQITESDDIKDLRRKITEIKNVIEAEKMSEMNRTEDQYTESEELAIVRKNKDEYNGSELAHVEADAEIKKLDDVESNYLSPVSAKTHIDCCKENNSTESYMDLEDKKLEIILENSSDAVDVSISAVSTGLCNSGTPQASDSDLFVRQNDNESLEDNRLTHAEINYTNASMSDIKTHRLNVGCSNNSEGVGLDLRNKQKAIDVVDESGVDMRINNNYNETKTTVVTDSCVVINSMSTKDQATNLVNNANLNRDQEINKIRSTNSNVACGLYVKSFTDENDFTSHQVEHPEDCNLSNECRFCQRKFNRPFDLQCHILIKHRNNSGPILGLDNTCPEKSSNLNLNSKVQNIEISTKTNLNISESDAYKENEILVKGCGFRCKYCDKLCENEKQYVAHVQTHSAEKPYTCAVCLREFAHKHNLNRHMMSHSAKNHQCETCGRSFKETYYLQMHRKIHAKESTRVCEICSVDVARSDFWSHMNTHLGGILKNPTYSQIGERVKELVQDQNCENNLPADQHQFRNVLKSRNDDDMNYVHDVLTESSAGLKFSGTEIETKFPDDHKFNISDDTEMHHGKENVRILPSLNLASAINCDKRSVGLQLNVENLSLSKVKKQRMLSSKSEHLEFCDSVPDSTTDY